MFQLQTPNVVHPIGNEKLEKFESRRGEPIVPSKEAHVSDVAPFSFEENATGKFLVARRTIAAGTLLVSNPGTIRTLPDMHTFQSDDATHVDCAEPGIVRFFNHSCAPNARILISADPAEVSLEASSEIQPGEVICWDYCTSEWDMESPFDCTCGAATCRGRVQGFKWMTAAQRAAVNQASISTYILARAERAI
mmetsp:Transcript_13721/g.33287  ORF Transcript_13721/g.33287 Transcript_13721/m.33287 type:complete len:194 (+) Transcript_13721:46-627(+)